MERTHGSRRAYLTQSSTVLRSRAAASCCSVNICSRTFASRRSTNPIAHSDAPITRNSAAAARQKTALVMVHLLRERPKVRKSQLQQDTDGPEPRGKKRERREPALVGPVLLHLNGARRPAIDIANGTEHVLLVCRGIEPAARRFHGGLPDPVW